MLIYRQSKQGEKMDNYSEQLKEARTELRKFLPDAALHSIHTSRSDTNFIVEVPPNEYLLNGLQLEVSANCATEAKISAIKHLFARVEAGKLDDEKYPIVLETNVNKTNDKPEKKKGKTKGSTEQERNLIFKYLDGDKRTKLFVKLEAIYKKYKNKNSDDIFIKFLNALFLDKFEDYVTLKTEILKITS